MEREVLEIITELKITVKVLKDEVNKLQKFEKRILELERRTTKVEQKVLVIYTVIGGALGALISALAYKLVGN